MEGLQQERQDQHYRAMASKAMVQIAKDLRQRQTSAEAIVWECLRNRRLNGLKFRRQHPIAGANYVADFFNYESHLVIELDGDIHLPMYEQFEVELAELKTKEATKFRARQRLESYLNEGGGLKAIR